MIRRWWGTQTSFDVAMAVRHLRENPNAPRFAALHVVGEGYDYRNRFQEKTALPLEMRQANTLRALAEVYGQPLDEFQRLNREQGWAADQPLNPGTQVNVPDPDFAPLLAARFAAEAL